MASDDDEELAQLRAQRRGPTLSALRQKLQKQQDASAYFEAPTERSGQAAAQVVVEEEDDEDGAGSGMDAVEEEAHRDFELRQHFPLSFGAQEAEKESLEAVHQATIRKEEGEEATGPPEPSDLQNEPEVGPVMPPDEATNGSEDPFHLPITHEVTLEGQGKAVSSVDVDHTGSRVLTGSRDYTLKMFDFPAMRSNMRSFRSIEPSEGHPVLAASWSPTGDAFFVVTGSAQVKVYDRDGKERGESVRGDMYIRDQRHTKGHVSPATFGQWHPTDKSTAMSSGEDGSVRLWDTEEVTQKMVIKPTLLKPGRVSVSTCAFTADGYGIGAALTDGTLQTWDTRGSASRAAAVEQVPVARAQMVARQDWRYIAGGGQVARGAHAAGTEVTSLAFSEDGTTLLSRSADDTLKVWDLRKFKKPLATFEDLPALFSTTGVTFSPDQRLFATGVSAGRDGKGGALVIFDCARLQVVRRVAMPASVIAVHWHPRLNQILLGTGDKQGGTTRVLYSPSYSERGVLLCAHRKLRAKDPFDFEVPLIIHNPHALPLFRQDRPRKRHLDDKPKDASLRMRPDPGATALAGTGSGGEIGVTGGTLLTQYILKTHGKLHNPREEDIRAKILRHAGKEDQFTELYSKAYQNTQPKRIYAEPDEEEETEKK